MQILRVNATVSSRGANVATPSKALLPPAPKAKGNLPSSRETHALIRQRRSIFPKDFTGEKVSDQEIEMLLEAANWAPTHHRIEPWRFVVLASKDAQLKAVRLALKISEDTLEEGKELDKRRMKTQMMIDKKLPNVSHMIVIGCRHAPNKAGKMAAEWEDAASTACAVQNLHLQATAMSIAGYWSSWPADDIRASAEFKALLGWGESDRCMGAFFLGRSDSADSYRAARGAIADKVTWLR